MQKNALPLQKSYTVHKNGVLTEPFGLAFMSVSVWEYPWWDVPFNPVNLHEKVSDSFDFQRKNIKQALITWKSTVSLSERLGRAWSLFNILIEILNAGCITDYHSLIFPHELRAINTEYIHKIFDLCGEKKGIFTWCHKLETAPPGALRHPPRTRGWLRGTADRETVTIPQEVSGFVPPPHGGGGVA